MSNFKLNTCKAMLDMIETKKEKLKIVYQWVKTNHISANQFLELCEHITRVVIF